MEVVENPSPKRFEKVHAIVGGFAAPYANVDIRNLFAHSLDEGNKHQSGNV